MITPIEKVMTQNLLTIRTGSSLFDANELMKENRIRHLPVVDSSDDVVGILSIKDIKGASDSTDITVDMMMSSPVIFIHQKTPLRQAILKMLENKISCLLVADDKDNAAGIVTTDDLLWFLAHDLEQEHEDRAPLISAMDRQTIGEVANKLSIMGI